MIIYYDSKTGNVQRFVDKIKVKRENWKFIKITQEMLIEEDGHFITFTTKIGEVPESTSQFLNNENNVKYIKSVSSSGNMNWGVHFAKASNKINEKYNIPILMKFELSGTQNQVDNFIESVENEKI